MKLFTVDLYEHFGYKRLDGAGGILHCYVLDTPSAISPSRTHPAVLILPGGGYCHVSPREGEPVALRFLNLGYCAFVLEYSVLPIRYPTALKEAAMAMRFVRTQSDVLNVESRMVVAMGFSAGGHLCGCLGTLFDSADVADIGAPEQIRPDALCLCYPVAVSWGPTHDGSFECLCGTDRELRSQLSLDRLVRRDMPPVFLWHTRNDQAVPCRNSIVLAQCLEELDVSFSMHIYRNGPHGLSTADAQAYPAAQIPRVSPDVPGWINALLQFLDESGFAVTDRGSYV